jgi:GT2 family glycosyltransferase
MTPNGRLWFDDRSGADRMLAKHAEVTTRSLAGDCCVRFADGGAFLIDRQLFLDIGGFDENFFLYYEDDDFSHRIVQRGEPIIVVNDAVVTHAIGNSVAKNPRNLIARFYAKKASEIYFKRKYGIAYDPFKDGAILALKALFYLVIFRQRQFLSALGQFKAIIDNTRGISTSIN